MSTPTLPDSCVPDTQPENPINTHPGVAITALDGMTKYNETRVCSIARRDFQSRFKFLSHIPLQYDSEGNVAHTCSDQCAKPGCQRKAIVDHFKAIGQLNLPGISLSFPLKDKGVKEVEKIKKAETKELKQASGYHEKSSSQADESTEVKKSDKGPGDWIVITRKKPQGQCQVNLPAESTFNTTATLLSGLAGIGRKATMSGIRNPETLTKQHMPGSSLEESVEVDEQDKDIFGGWELVDRDGAKKNMAKDIAYLSDDDDDNDDDDDDGDDDDEGIGGGISPMEAGNFIVSLCASFLKFDRRVDSPTHI
jgi:hypothetical protein